MLRKSLIVVTLLLLMPMSIQAKSVRRYLGFPIYLPSDTCVIPVTMDIGMYVEILDVSSYSIKLQQVAFETFEGCTDIRIKSNFDLELGCKIKSTGMVPGDYSCWIDNPKVPLDLSEKVSVRKVCAKADNVKVLYVPPGSDVHVANVIVTVIPDF